MTEKRMVTTTYVNTKDTASGADEMIVELMKKLIRITDENVISSIDIKVTYHPPVCEESTSTSTVKMDMTYLQMWLTEHLAELFYQREEVSYEEMSSFLTVYTEVYKKCRQLTSNIDKRKVYQLNKYLQMFQMPFIVSATKHEGKLPTYKLIRTFFTPQRGNDDD